MKSLLQLFIFLSLSSFLIISCQESGSGGGSDASGDGSDTSGDGLNAVLSLSLSPSDKSFVVNYLSDIQYTATATLDDDTTSDVTESTTWTSSDLSVATINDAAGQKGIASPKAYGITSITATLGDKSATGSLIGYLVGEDSSPNSPILISPGMEGIHRGEVNNGTNYYYSTGLSEANLSVELYDMSHDVDLLIFNNAEYTGTAVCKPYYGRQYDEECTGQASNKVNDDSLYFTIDGSDSPYGSSFKINVTDEGGNKLSSEYCDYSQGVSDPVLIDDVYVLTEGASNSISYYSFNATPGETYWINITDVDSNLDLVYFDNDDSYTTEHSSSTNSGASNEYLQVTPSSELAYFTVNDIRGSGECFDITFRKPEGTAQDPIALNVEKSNFALVDLQSSYFVFSVTEGTQYSAKIEGLGGFRSVDDSLACDVDLYLYDDDSTFTASVNSSYCPAIPKDSTTDSETCQVSASGNLFFAKVSKGSTTCDNENAKGAIYKLSLTAQ